MKKKTPRLLKTTETLSLTWEIRRGRPHLVAVEVEPDVVTTIKQSIPFVAAAGIMFSLLGAISGKKRGRK